MSSYICELDHIALLSAYYLRKISKQNNLSPNKNIDEAVGVSMDFLKMNCLAVSSRYLCDFPDDYKQMQKELKGIVEWILNAGDKTPILLDSASPVAIIKSAQCLDYQLCDYIKYTNSKEEKIINKIYNHCINLSGFDSINEMVDKSKEYIDFNWGSFNEVFIPPEMNKEAYAEELLALPEDINGQDISFAVSAKLEAITPDESLTFLLESISESEPSETYKLVSLLSASLGNDEPDVISDAEIGAHIRKGLIEYMRQTIQQDKLEQDASISNVSI